MTTEKTKHRRELSNEHFELECEGRCSCFGECQGTVSPYVVIWSRGKRATTYNYCEEGARLTAEMGYNISEDAKKNQ
jgi:hypothetical protein